MVCAYFGLVNRSPGFFCLAATVGGGGGGGEERFLEPPFVTSKLLMIRPPKLHKVFYSFFPKFRHNWADTMSRHIVEFIEKIQIPSIFLGRKNRNTSFFRGKKSKF